MAAKTEKKQIGKQQYTKRNTKTKGEKHEPHHQPLMISGDLDRQADPVVYVEPIVLFMKV